MTSRYPLVVDANLVTASVGLAGAIVGSLATQVGESVRQSIEPKKHKKQRQREAVADFLRVCREETGGISFPKLPDEIATQPLSFWNDQMMDLIPNSDWEKWKAEGDAKFDTLNTILIAWEQMHLRLIDKKVRTKSRAVRDQLRAKHSDAKPSVRQLVIVKYGIYLGPDFYKATRELADTANQQLN